jgi:adenylosuccinate lyase
MRENLQLSHQLVYAEAVMMALAPELGRQKAHDLVDEAVSDARSGKPFFEALQQSEEINNILSESVLSKILSGQTHIDAAAQEVKVALANCDRGK